MGNSTLYGDSNYIKLVDAYNKATPNAVIKEAGYRYWFLTTVAIYTLVSAIAVAFGQQYQNYIIFTGALGMFVSVYYLIKKTEKKFQEKHGDKSLHFLKTHHLFWRGERAFLFFEEIKKQKIEFDPKEIEEIIDSEIELKKSDFLKMPFMIFMLPILYALISELFKHMQTAYLVFTLVAVFIIIGLYQNILSVFRIEEAKLKDFKLFIRWHNSIVGGAKPQTN